MLKLNKTQKKICDCLLLDMSNREMATELGLAYITIKMNISKALRENNLKTRVGLALAYYKDNSEC